MHVAAAATAAAGSASLLQLEWPATWCYLSVVMCLIALAAELYAVKIASRTRHNGRNAAEQHRMGPGVKTE